MKKVIKLLCLCLSIVMALGCFAACGNKDNETADNSGDTSAKTIVIGSTGPLTGDAAVYGMAVKNAAELAVKEINEAGGVNGINLEFKMEDDVADSEKVVAAYNKLKDEDMKVFLGTVTTGACLSIIDKTKQDGIFQLTPSASAADVVKNDNCFQVCFTDPNQGKVSADYIADNKVASKVAVIYDSSDAYSTGIYNTFKAEAAAKGLNIVSEKSFTKDNKTDFSAQIGDAKTNGAELVFLPIYYAEAAQILKQSKSAGLSLNSSVATVLTVFSVSKTSTLHLLKALCFLLLSPLTLKTKLHRILYLLTKPLTTMKYLTSSLLTLTTVSKSSLNVSKTVTSPLI